MVSQTIALPTELTRVTVECRNRTCASRVLLCHLSYKDQRPKKGVEPLTDTLVENNARLSSIQCLNEHCTVELSETHTSLLPFVFPALPPG